MEKMKEDRRSLKKIEEEDEQIEDRRWKMLGFQRKKTKKRVRDRKTFWLSVRNEK